LPQHEFRGKGQCYCCALPVLSAADPDEFRDESPAQTREAQSRGTHDRSAGRALESPSNVVNIIGALRHSLRPKDDFGSAKKLAVLGRQNGCEKLVKRATR